MSTRRLIIAIDQGTTSSRAILFDEDGTTGTAVRRIPTAISSWWLGRHDRRYLADYYRCDICHGDSSAFKGNPLIAFGIANQRETALIWDRAPAHP